MSPELCATQVGGVWVSLCPGPPCCLWSPGLGASAELWWRGDVAGGGQ